MSKLLAVAACACLLSVGNTNAPHQPADPVLPQTEAQKAAARAADCADFPQTVVRAIGKYYDPEGAIEFSVLPASYNIRRVAVYPEGGCRVEPASALPAIPPGDRLAVFHAIGIVDMDAPATEENPFYVVIELDGPPATHREYYVLKLPKPAPQGEGPLRQA